MDTRDVPAPGSTRHLPYDQLTYDQIIFALGEEIGDRVSGSSMRRGWPATKLRHWFDWGESANPRSQVRPGGRLDLGQDERYPQFMDTTPPKMEARAATLEARR